MPRSIWLEERWWRAFYSKDFSLELIVREVSHPEWPTRMSIVKKLAMVYVFL